MLHFNYKEENDIYEGDFFNNEKNGYGKMIYSIKHLFFCY